MKLRSALRLSKNSTHNTLQQWHAKQTQALHGESKHHNKKQKLLGKKLARERLAALLDPGSFEEIDQLATSPFSDTKQYTDGVIVGFGSIDNRRIALYCQDATIKGGSLGKRHAQKVCKIMDMAAKIGCPIIGILDSSGARIDEGIHALAGYGEIMHRNVRYSGVVPQLSLVLGPCAGGAAYSPALTDFIFTTQGISQLFITGPQVIKKIMHQDITKEELGGAAIHAQSSGVVHVISDTEDDCFLQLRTLLSYLPDNYRSLPPYSNTQEHQDKTTTPASSVVPNNPNHSYDIKKLIDLIFDHDTLFEIQALFAPHIIVGFARLDGYVVAIVANQPLIKAGILDIDASCKAARFIQFCDAFNIPIISLVDVPGFLPGIEQEHNGIIRHGAKLIAAYAQATVPKITVIIRKAFGGAYIVMGSKHVGGDFNFAWPQAHIAVLGPQAAITILHGRKLSEINDHTTQQAKQDALEKEYATTHLNPFIAAEHGYIDAIIDPDQTRNHLVRALAIMREKVEQLPKRKHGNPPL